MAYLRYSRLDHAHILPVRVRSDPSSRSSRYVDQTSPPGSGAMAEAARAWAGLSGMPIRASKTINTSRGWVIVRQRRNERARRNELGMQ